MKKLLMLVMVLGLLVSGCMASFPKTYSPKFSVDPKAGENQAVTAIAKFETAFGKEAKDESLKLQTLVDRKIEQWGFTKGKTGRHLDITVKNVVDAGNLSGAVFTGILCGATLYIIPGVSTDKYRMTVVINEEGKEPAIRQYNSSITTYTQIAFIFWGLFTYPIKNAMYTCIEDMLDHCLNELSTVSKATIQPDMIKQSGSASSTVFPQNISLPKEIAIKTPSSELPKEIAAFVGTWKGTWKSGTVFNMIVTKINSEKAELYFASSENPSMNITESGDYQTGQIVYSGGKFQIQYSGSPFRFKSGTVGARPWVTLEMQKDLKTIKVIAKYPKDTSTGTAEKIE